MRPLLILLPMLIASCVKQEPAVLPPPSTNSDESPRSSPKCSVGTVAEAPAIPTSAAELRYWLMVHERMDAAIKDGGNRTIFTKFDVYPIPGSRRLFLVIEDCGAQRYACVYACNSEVVKYLGLLGEDGYTDVGGFEILSLPQFSNPVVAIYATTSRGNGSFYLYEIANTKPMERLRRNLAIGEGWAGKGRCMVPTWIDLNNDAYTDLVLAGTRHVVHWDERSATEEVTESYVWKPSANCFMRTS
jgi:hypothetical protein